ncbi:SULP2 [Auxenochlorella protothecoides x Auxenochlorella symbiontica]
MALIVILPFANVFVQAFSKGIGPFLAVLAEPEFRQAVKMTLLLSAVAVPINTVFGVLAALFLSRNRFRGKELLISFMDLPFAISPVVTGMMFVLLYGRSGLFAPLISRFGFNIVFAFPGMALATMFVTMPFVVRELMPVLEEMDIQEEEAATSLGASGWQTFWKVTLPNIRWGLLYGIILTNARAMGEFGAVSVISGNIIGQTQTLTLFVESSYKEYNSEAAFAAAVLLSILAVVTLFLKDRLERAAAKEKNEGK